jgi:tetratricopeptide (TPR) repeat protein
MKKLLHQHPDVIIWLVLIGLTLAVFGQVRKFDFVNYDDRDYITQNRHVQAGWTRDGVFWSLKAKVHGHWHPLTWLSHMTDAQLFGLNPGFHHLMNLMFHIANTLLLFWVLSRMTGARYRSAFVAALFALHPLHVEPVAWVAARKDLLSTFFWMSSIVAYFYYVKRPGVLRYGVVLAMFVLGLMSKAMIVTLPLVLLLLDYWPLGRWHTQAEPAEADSAGKRPILKNNQIRLGIRLVSEKVLFFLLLGGSAFISVLFMRYERLPEFSLWKVLPKTQYVLQALVFYVHYIIKMLWPFDLATPYPKVEIAPPVWQAVGAVVFLTVMSAVAIDGYRRRPYLFVGWLWYLVTLLPVIGLIRFGPHTLADRYTYISLIGLFIIIAWGVPDMIAGRRRRRLVLGVAGGIAVAACIVIAYIQTAYWQNSVTLLTHTVEVTKDNWIAHTNLGVALKDEGRFEESEFHYKEALRINPKDFMAFTNLGFAKMYQGKHEEGTQHFYEAVKRNPQDAQAHFALGLILKEQGNCEEASKHFAESLRISPRNSKAHVNWGLCSASAGNDSEALRHFSEALKIDPDNMSARMNLGIALMKQGQRKEAIDQFQEAVRLDPNDAKARYILGTALNEEGRLDEAANELAMSIRMDPGNPKSHNQLGIVAARQGEFSKAERHFMEAVRLEPGNSRVHMNLGFALKDQGKIEDAAKQFSEVLRIDPNNEKAKRELEAVQKRLKEK